MCALRWGASVNRIFNLKVRNFERGNGGPALAAGRARSPSPLPFNDLPAATHFDTSVLSTLIVNKKSYLLSIKATKPPVNK